MLKINIEIEEHGKNCQVKIQNENFDNAELSEKQTAIQIYNHLKLLFNEVNAEKKQTKPKKKTTKKKEEK